MPKREQIIKPVLHRVVRRAWRCADKAGFDWWLHDCRCPNRGRGRRRRRGMVREGMMQSIMKGSLHDWGADAR